MSKLGDQELLGHVRRAVDTDPRARSADQVHIAVEDGVVKLWGEVLSAAERNAIEEIARAQPGSRDVANALTVAMARPAEKREKLAAAVRQTLARAAGIDPRHVSVSSADHGVVRLIGRASSLAEENAAIAAASTVPGVREVISEMVIGDVEPGSAVAVFDDAAIKSLVGRAIAERGIVIYEERTAVNNGIVYLRGGVAERRAAELAESVAAVVTGVKDIVNELHVEHSLASANPDELLSAQVTHALQLNGRVSPAQVHVQCVGGDAHLSGFVDSIDQQNAATEIARGVHGVRNVHNDTVIVDRTSMGAMEREQGRQRER